MSEPTLSYGHGFQSDCDSLTGYGEHEDGNVGATTVLNGDYFDLNITGSGGNKIYWWGNTGALGLSSTTYSKALFRFKTSDTSIKAKVELVFTGAEGEQTLMDETSSTTWKVVAADIDTGKTIDYVRLYANQATGHVYYDFVLLYTGIFTFPSTTLVDPHLPPARWADIDIWGRDGDRVQQGGSKPVTVHITADMGHGSWGDPAGEVFWRNAHETSANIWYWLTLPKHKLKFKVTIRDPSHMPCVKKKIQLDLLLKEFKRAPFTVETHAERFGIE